MPRWVGKNKNIRFDSPPWFKHTHPLKEDIKFEKENTFDPHIEIVKKVDTLIAENEKETWFEESEVVSILKNNYWE